MMGCKPEKLYFRKMGEWNMDDTDRLKFQGLSMKWLVGGTRIELVTSTV